MSAVSKGNSYEIEVKKTLEACGWQVFRQHRKPLFIKGHMITVGCDIFGCDLVAKQTGTKAVWIQVSTPENLSAKKKQVEEHPINLDHETYEIWSRVSGKKEFEVHRLQANLALGHREWNRLPNVKVRLK